MIKVKVANDKTILPCFTPWSGVKDSLAETCVQTCGFLELKL